MRIAKVIGKLTLNTKPQSLNGGRFLIVDVLDGQALDGLDRHAKRATPMPDSLVVYDNLGAGVGELIAVSEGREAAMPFGDRKVPIDAYCAAILDSLQVTA